MGPNHLGAMIFYLAVISAFTAGDNYPFFFQLTPDNMTYSMSLSNETVKKWYTDLCFNTTSATSIADSTVKSLHRNDTDALYRNVFSCKHVDQTNFTCTRQATPECDMTERFFEFHSTLPTSCPYQCIGICYSNYAPRSSWQFYFTPAQINDRRCERATEPSGVQTASATTVELSVLIIVAAVSGSVIIVLTVALLVVAICTCRRPKVTDPEFSPSSSVIPPTRTEENLEKTTVIPPTRTTENQAQTTVIPPTRATEKQAQTTVMPRTHKAEKKAPTRDRIDRQATSHVYANKLADPSQLETSRISSPYVNL
ncbi:unnamed protein product [Lymnaea stagnalis]|uniref:Uncharacterized protein n=1 Tax=Lymnaea stagnalis TaxID=6523 RepID=A0AAV2H4L7_LYMST